MIQIVTRKTKTKTARAKTCIAAGGSCYWFQIFSFVKSFRIGKMCHMYYVGTIVVVISLCKKIVPYIRILLAKFLKKNLSNSLISIRK